METFTKPDRSGRAARPLTSAAFAALSVLMLTIQVSPAAADGLFVRKGLAAGRKWCCCAVAWRRVQRRGSRCSPAWRDRLGWQRQRSCRLRGGVQTARLLRPAAAGRPPGRMTDRCRARSEAAEAERMARLPASVFLNGARMASGLEAAAPKRRGPAGPTAAPPHLMMASTTGTEPTQPTRANRQAVDGTYERGSGGSRTVTCIDATGSVVECP